MRASLITSDSLASDDELINYNKNISDKIWEIYKPLAKVLNSNFFEYHKFFDDYSFLCISTNIEWHEYYIKNFIKSTLVKNHIKKVFDERIKYYSLPLGSTEGKFSEFVRQMNKYNIYNYFTTYIHQENSIEAFSFATENFDSNFINIYLNKIDELYRFFVHFYDKTSNIIDFSNNHKNINPKEGFLTKNKANFSKQDKKVEDFLKATEISRYPVMIGNDIKYLTSRQAQCVYYLSKGRTYKEIGRILNIGARCVESHITLTKLKMGCSSTSCLIKMFEQNKILQNMLFFIGGK